MGKRGPAGAPTAVRVLRGDRKDRINRNEPKPGRREVEPQTELEPRARAVWDRLAPDLIAKGVLTPWDVDEFAEFCRAVVINDDALRDVERNGPSCTTPVRELSDGTVVYELRRNPAWQVARETAAVMLSLASRFGLTPSDRAQLRVGDARDAEDDDLLTG